jgi:hypothetical protein
MLEFKMNERIYDIEKQAWEFVDKTWNWANANNPSQATLFKAKFAELIVRECLSIVEPTEDSGDEWCVTLKGTAQEIKEHFGVE